MLSSYLLRCVGENFSTSAAADATDVGKFAIEPDKAGHWTGTYNIKWELLYLDAQSPKVTIVNANEY